MNGCVVCPNVYRCLPRVVRGRSGWNNQEMLVTSKPLQSRAGAGAGAVPEKKKPTAHDVQNVSGASVVVSAASYRDDDGISQPKLHKSVSPAQAKTYMGLTNQRNERVNDCLMYGCQSPLVARGWLPVKELVDLIVAYAKPGTGQSVGRFGCVVCAACFVVVTLTFSLLSRVWFAVFLLVSHTAKQDRLRR